MKNAIQNFQIPVVDFDRALKFYQSIMGDNMQTMEFEGSQMGLFACDSESGVGGVIIRNETLRPSDHGTLVYLNAGEDLAPSLDRVEANGGEIVIPKTLLGPGMGYYAIFKDCEGNRVGLYSPK